MSQENRIHARISVEAEVRVSGASGVQSGRLSDLSKGGAAIFLTEAAGLVGHTVDFFLPTVGDEEIAIMAEIVRSESTPNGVLHGLRFSLVEPVMRGRLDNYIESLLKKQGEKVGQRRAPRLAKRVPVHFRDAKQVPAMLKSISSGGLAMTMAKPMALYEEVQLVLPDTNNRELLILNGKVIYQHRLDEAKTSNYTVGFKFEAMTALTRRCLEALLTAFMGVE